MMPEGEDCQLYIDESPTKHCSVVFQVTRAHIIATPVKESKELAALISKALRDSLGGYCSTRSPSYSDLGRSIHLEARMPACLVYLAPRMKYYTETKEGSLHVACAVYSALEKWRMWLMGRTI